MFCDNAEWHTMQTLACIYMKEYLFDPKYIARIKEDLKCVTEWTNLFADSRVWNENICAFCR